MKTQTIQATHLKTICWWNNMIVDWAAGTTYSLDGTVKQLVRHYAFDFDTAITSADGKYVFIYNKLGTKGLLLKNGELIKEINRPYYCANVYEFPAAFATLKDKTYLIHCPVAYNQLDFEDVDTGEIITNIKDRNPDDRFHSRLEVSPAGIFLMSKGWVWHPFDEINIYDIKQCIKNPLLLDHPQFRPNVNVEISTASFINNKEIVIGSSDGVLDEDDIGKLPPKHICLYNFTANQFVKPIKTKEEFGNLFAINANHAWDMFGFPKIIDINTGEIVDKNNEINSGKQQSSIINSTDYFPSIIFNKQTGQIAINSKNKIEVLTPDQGF
ncbi:MAG TPA: hypothetical protein VHA56_19965 [Mucilaginibacter sp.]|nr:hypothetical protein [Mucilaginibacter sp.]